MQGALAILGSGVGDWEASWRSCHGKKLYDRGFVGFRSGTVHINGAFFIIRDQFLEYKGFKVAVGLDWVLFRFLMFCCAVRLSRAGREMINSHASRVLMTITKSAMFVVTPKALDLGMAETSLDVDAPLNISPCKICSE